MSFFDGGNKSLSFGEKGDNTWRGVWQGGVILNIGQPVAAMGYPDTTKPKTFKNGEQVMKIVISLDTRAGRFPAPPIDAEDDGTRDWHLDKGFGQYKAVGKALRDAGVKDLEVGGTLYVQWTGGEGNIGDPRKFLAAYQPPVGTGGFMQEAVAPPAAQPPAAPPPPAFPPQQQAPAQQWQAPAGQPGPIQQMPAQASATAEQLWNHPATQSAVTQAAQFDPATGQPLAQQAPQNPAPYGYDPATGQPLTAPPAQQPVPAAAGPVTNPFAQ